jgi:hypothetical protein
MSPSGVEHATFWLVVHCLNHLSWLCYIYKNALNFPKYHVGIKEDQFISL